VAPCIIAWDAETDEFRRVEGPEGFTTWEEADKASRFLLRTSSTSRARRAPRLRSADPDGGLDSRALNATSFPSEKWYVEASGRIVKTPL